MAVVAYCMMDAGERAHAPGLGVRSGKVQSVDVAGLRCFFSEVEGPPAGAEQTRREALEFYAVVQAIFREVEVIPFRFPTLLGSIDELRTFMEIRGAQYLAALQGLKGKAQMELRITPAHAPSGNATSGKEYLKLRQESLQELQDAAHSARMALNLDPSKWRQHETAQGLRCYALITRQKAAGFKQQMAAFKPETAVHVAVSGPWPPTEFVDVESES